MLCCILEPIFFFDSTARDALITDSSLPLNWNLEFGMRNVDCVVWKEIRCSLFIDNLEAHRSSEINY